MSAARFKSKTELPLHVTMKNAKDGIAGDQENCTFGQCDTARAYGMKFFVIVDPLNPEVWAEWVDRGPQGGLRHNRGRVVRRHPDGSETVHEAITILSGTDSPEAHRAFVKRFPREGMDFRITDITHRTSAAGTRVWTPEQLRAKAERKRQLKAERDAGLAPPPRPRKPRVTVVRARFGS